MANVQHIYTGTTAPATTPPAVGHHYVDTVAKILYISVDIVSAADWKQLTTLSDAELTEYIQDAIGSALADTASIDFTYSDGGNSITADVIPAGIDHNSLQNFVANKHVDHSTVSISAGTGLSGGGDITANRTISLANTSVTPGSYTNADLTVDAQGRITAVSSGADVGGVWGAITGTLSSQTDLNSALGGKQDGPLTGDVTTSGAAATLANTSVTPGSYTAADITIDSKGRITAAANGTAGAAAWGTITGTLSAQTDLDSALSAKQDDITGSSERFVYKNGSGNIVSLEPVQVGLSAGWEQLDLTRDMNGISGSFDIYRNNIVMNALQASPDEGWNVSNNQINVDSILSGFNMGTNTTAFRFHVNNIYHNGTSDIGATEFTQNNFSFGNGTDPIDVKGFAYMMGFGVFNANVNVSGPMQGYGFQPNANSAATISSTTFIQGFYDAANINCTTPNYSSFNASPSIFEVANNNNYNALAINPNITGYAGNAGAFGISIGGNWGTFDTAGGFNGVAVNPGTADNAHYANGIAVYMDGVNMYPGTISSVVIQDLTIAFILPGDNNIMQIEFLNTVIAGSETATISGNLITVNLESGVSTATQVKAALDANMGFIGNATATITGTASNPQVTQAPTNFTGGTWPGTKRAAYLDGDVEITGALSFGGALSVGKLNAFATQALVDTGGNPQSIHSLITQPTVAANATLTSADMLGVNTAALISIGDNASVGTAFIGCAALGLPAVLSMGSGSTIDRVYGALFALSLDASATGGTADEVGLCKSVAIPNGVTTVNNLYGYLFDLPFGDPGTKTFGFYSRTTNHNYFGGDLLIGGTAGSDDMVTNSSVALEIKSTTKAFVASRMTTSEKNALTAIAGMMVFDTTLSQISYYDGSAWVNV